MEKAVLTVKEVGQVLGLSRGTVEKLLATRKLPFVRVERLRLIPTKAVSNFIEGK